MNPSYDMLPGWKTYLAGVGFTLVGIYQLSQRDYSNAFQSFMAALAAFGVRNAIARNEALVLASHQELARRLEYHEAVLSDKLKHIQ